MNNPKFRFQMEKRKLKDGKSWGCSILTGAAVLTLAFLLSGCWVQFGPVVKNELLIIKAGVPVEILKNVTVRGHTLGVDSKDGQYKEIDQDIGGWVTMPPEHWEQVQAELKRLRLKCGEPEKKGV